MRFSADHVAIMELRKPSLFAVRLPTARSEAPSAVPTMTSATSTSSRVKPCCRVDLRMLVHREMADTIGMNSHAGFAAAQGQHKRLIYRLTTEYDTQAGIDIAGWRVQHQRQRRMFESALAQHVVLLRQFPLFFIADHKAVAIRPRLESDLAVAHDGFITRHLQQQRNALGIVAHALFLARQSVQAHQPQRDAQYDH